MLAELISVALVNASGGQGYLKVGDMLGCVPHIASGAANDETAHLLSTAANVQRLDLAIAELDAAGGNEHDLIDP